METSERGFLRKKVLCPSMNEIMEIEEYINKKLAKILPDNIWICLGKGDVIYYCISNEKESARSQLLECYPELEDSPLHYAKKGKKFGCDEITLVPF